MHIGMGLVCGSKIKDMIDVGFDFTIFLADWHSWINNKLSGDMDKIRTVGEYFKQCFTALGIPKDKIRYIWASELAADITYWEKVIRIAKDASVNRIQRTLPIMGRSTSTTDVETAMLIYPCMQVADIFHLNIDVACSGIDQRKAHMLARETASKFKVEKPVSVHTPLLMGLESPNKDDRILDDDTQFNMKIGAKMSKSSPNRCIFIHDTQDQIKKKISDAYCPPKDMENPIMDIAQHIIFPRNKSLLLERTEKYGGSITFYSFKELSEQYAKGSIHPLDLKNSVASALSNILEPVHEFFKDKNDLLKKVMNFETTR